MREIRFRAIHKLTKHWFEDIHIIYQDGEWFEDHRALEDGRPMNLDQVAIMQYTGLKDKNGAEIYEGDVLYVEQIDRIDPYIPHKKNVAVRYEGRDTAFVFDEEAGFVIGLYSTPRELEVIGNIYEDSELLGDSQ